MKFSKKIKIGICLPISIIFSEYGASEAIGGPSLSRYIAHVLNQGIFIHLLENALVYLIVFLITYGIFTFIEKLMEGYKSK